MTAPHVFPSCEAEHWEDGETPPRWLGLAVLTLLVALPLGAFVAWAIV